MPTQSKKPRKNILVIKHGALGDIIQALGAFAAIRAYHAGDHITLLTTKPYAEFAKTMPYFDQVWIDSKPKLWQVAAVLKLRNKLCSGQFARVYDLQTSTRSSQYFTLMGRPDWSGIAPGCLQMHSNPNRNFMHTLDRLTDQLEAAGLDRIPKPDLSWVPDDTERFGLPPNFALLIAGGSPHRPAKRWPAERFGELARILAEQKIIPVLIGTRTEKDELDTIQKICPQAISLMGKTSFSDIAALGRKAMVCIGNDTGPVHIAAVAGSPCVVLFSDESNPDLCAPRGRVAILKKPSLADMPLAEVLDGVKTFVPL